MSATTQATMAVSTAVTRDSTLALRTAAPRHATLPSQGVVRLLQRHATGNSRATSCSAIARSGGIDGTNAATSSVAEVHTGSSAFASRVVPDVSSLSTSLIVAALIALFGSSSPAIAADAAADVVADVATAPASQELVASIPGTSSRFQAFKMTAPPLMLIPPGETALVSETADVAPVEAEAAPEIAEAPKVVDGARLLTESQRAAMQRQLTWLEASDGFQIRVATRYGPGPESGGMDNKQMRDLWKPSDHTVIVVADVSSPNMLSFSMGEAVRAKLPYQFFVELQSRYGNQFFVRQEGESEALTRSVDAIRTCLAKPEGCLKVPGLVDDLYFLTLAISVAAGAVFGFSARLPPQGQVEASWQWTVIFSPLWLLLLLAFGVFPVIDRTAELEPLIKNLLGFGGGAAAIYMTPILGESPIAKLGKTGKDGSGEDQ